MNLHIVPDNVFINKFYENLQELGVADNNRIVVRTNSKKLKYIKWDFPFAPLYSSHFNSLTGATKDYDRVFIHLFTPLLYRWVATHDFNDLNWIVWGADLYNLPCVNTQLYEELTLREYVNRTFSLQGFLYRAKVRLLHDAYRIRAYEKVNNVLTWMTSEYDFAMRKISSLKADHKFFFYENEVPYQALNRVIAKERPAVTDKKPLFILGNSATPELNHLDAVSWMEAENVNADLCVPISYGDSKYALFLKKRLSSYKGGNLRFLDQYMKFPDYVELLYSADGLIMNNIRPQGYGNILIMMYLGKKVFLNDKNLSTPELQNAGLIWRSLKNINLKSDPEWTQNKHAVSSHLSHDLLLKTYRELFA